MLRKNRKDRKENRQNIAAYNEALRSSRSDLEQYHRLETEARGNAYKEKIKLWNRNPDWHS